MNTFFLFGSSKDSKITDNTKDSIPELRESILSDGCDPNENDDMTTDDDNSTTMLSLSPLETGTTTPSKENETSLRLQAAEETKTNEYLNQRVMTPLQERVNGLTTLPAGFYCLFFLLSGAWLDQSLVERIRSDGIVQDQWNGGEGCLSISWFPQLHALPPLPVIAAGMSMILHMPFSFIYHWTYAHKLSPTARIEHWSRRMDQSMLHVYSTLLSYAYSGRMDYFLINAAYNADCIVKLFEPKIIPKRNQTRLILSILAFTLPILEIGDYSYFFRLWRTMLLAFAVFAAYPVGGWSHTLFHLIFLTVPPMMMTYIPTLEASQEQLIVAAKCSIWAESQYQ